MTAEDDKYIVVHVAESHKFWSGSEWLDDPTKAATYDTYAAAARVIWRELPAPTNGRLVAVPKHTIYDLRKESAPN